MSLELFHDELTQYYRNPTVSLPGLNLTFRDYMVAYQTLKYMLRYERDRRYWLNKIPTFPLAPELPFLENPATAIQPRFERKLATIEKRVWQQFKKQAQRYNLSPTSVLLAVYGQVLARWSKTPHFLINLTLFNRFPLHPQVNSILGDFTVLELFEFGATPADASDNSTLSFLTHIQKNLWDDLDHRFFTGIMYCVNWRKPDGFRRITSHR